MAAGDKKSDLHRYGAKGQAPGAARLQLAAIGMEAEFALFVDDRQVKPEDLFGDPRAFLKGRLMHRVGTSYSLPTGGAVYFDTGVIEVATPVIEIEPGCAARAGRSLWESIHAVRGALDAWEQETGKDARLVGFSAHYNISFELPEEEQGTGRTVEKLALLLSYILPVPVMLLAANKRSTGIGVRPRGDRIEITADFTPSAALTIATGTLITGITRAVMRWPDFGLEGLAEHGLPVIVGYSPMPHTSRKGWLARKDRYPRDPFATSPDEAVWTVDPSYFEHREEEPRPLSLRDIAHAIGRHFSDPVEAVSNPFTFRLIRRVLHGEAPSLLELADRPPEYDDVGRLCLWDDLFPERVLRRSRYEQVLIRAIAGIPLRIRGTTYTPVGIDGWAEVVFRHPDGSRHAFTIDYLLDHLGAWKRRPKRS
jgi:hypothetical protein